jgi:hypothetical protein
LIDILGSFTFPVPLSLHSQRKKVTQEFILTPKLYQIQPPAWRIQLPRRRRICAPDPLHPTPKETLRTTRRTPAQEKNIRYAAKHLPLRTFLYQAYCRYGGVLKDLKNIAMRSCSGQRKDERCFVLVID